MEGSAVLPRQLVFADISLGIVCPMANEGATAVLFVTEVLKICASFGFKDISFFVIVDNASNDNTQELLESLGLHDRAVRVIWAPENRNVVDAYMRGYREALAAGCDWILEIDAGYSHQPSDIPQFLHAMLNGFDCVFGTRFDGGGKMIESSLKRRLISRGGTALTNLVLGTRLTDMTSGFELFSRSILENVLERGIRSRGPFFQTEIKTYCRTARAMEVPIRYRAPSHHMNNAALTDAFKNLWRLLMLRVRGTL
ncbi:MAG: glycosyltransferase family 2 protein [Pyrinomonadaceae bacterium]